MLSDFEVKFGKWCLTYTFDGLSKLFESSSFFVVDEIYTFALIFSPCYPDLKPRAANQTVEF